MATGHGLFRLDDSGLQFVFQRPEYSGWQAVELDSEENVWFGGQDGVFRLHDNNVEPMPVLGTLPGGRVYAVAVNGDNTVWLRSGSGISHLVGKRIYNFAEESLAIEAAYPWTGRDSLWPVAPDGTLWLLVEGALWGYNQSGWKVVALDTTSDEHIKSYTAGANGMLVVAGNSGLHIYTLDQGWRLVPYPQGTDNIGGMIYDASTNTIWARNYFSDSPDRVIRYNLDTGEWTLFGEEHRIIPFWSFNGVGLSPAGEIWAANATGSVVVYRADGTWQSIIASADFLGVWGFGGIHFGNSGDLWLTTIENCGLESVCSTGLIYYDGTSWMRFTAENSGLSDNWISDVSVDSAGNAWLATSIGLQRAPLPLP